MTDLGEIRF
ncbi:unnamed protein product, partial [Rotaria sp. Silwood1]